MYLKTGLCVSHLAPSCAFSSGPFSLLLESKRKSPRPSMPLAVAFRATELHFIHIMVPEKHQNVIVVQGMDRPWWSLNNVVDLSCSYAGQVGNQRPNRMSSLCSETTPCACSNKLIIDAIARTWTYFERYCF